MKLRILMILFAFAAGVLAGSMYTVSADFSTPIYRGGLELPTGDPVDDVKMPKDRISEKQIAVFHDKVVLDIQNAQWSTFTPTKSMAPFLDKGANAIQLKPEEGCKGIEEGDIISYKSQYTDGVIIHRVLAKGTDSKGRYFLAKGDNNPGTDPGKIRCEQIERVLVAIIY